MGWTCNSGEELRGKSVDFVITLIFIARYEKFLSMRRYSAGGPPLPEQTFSYLVSRKGRENGVLIPFLLASWPDILS